MKKIRWKQEPGKEPGRLRFLKDGKLFYILLFLCIVVVGTTGYVVRERQAQQQAAALRSAAEQTQIAASQQTEDVPQEVAQQPEVLEQPAAQPAVVQQVEAADEPQQEQEADKPAEPETPPEPVRLILPVSGEVLKPHSDTDLVYSKTMDDWRLHQGMDIRADIGTTVSAAAAGTVEDFYEDPRLGITIVIDHGSGVKTRYCNLSSAEMVEKGKQVSKGDAIATVGDTAQFEVADEAHLHFEVLKDEKCVDPTSYLAN